MKFGEDSPTAGPSLDSVYVPGTPGAEWTDHEIETTRYRILQVVKDVKRYQDFYVSKFF